MPKTVPFNGRHEFPKGITATMHYTIQTDPEDPATFETISGWTFSFKVKRRDADPDPALATGTATIIDGPNGLVDIQVSTVGLMEGDYRYSLWRTNVGAKSELTKGFFSITDSVEN